MSFNVDPTSMGTGSMMQQLMRMNKQLNRLSQASSAQVPYADGTTVGNQTPDVEQAQAQQPNAAEKAGSFQEMLSQAFEAVNNFQNDAGDKQTRFDVGDRSLTLADVMLASQKASISFEATVQIRNKMVEAYRTISQMQI